MAQKFRSEIWSLLKKNISIGQFIGYAIANIVGLSVILIGIIFFGDSQHSSADDDNYFSDEYIVISKKVEGVGFEPKVFTEKEIKQLSKQKWVVKVGRFTASQFTVNATVSMGGQRLSSYIFFESIPDDFFDIRPHDWEFEPDNGFVPVILNKDYLTLYNFGFAIPQGLPQVSEKIVGSIPVTLRLSGRYNRTGYFDAAIVGFSSRLNTIAVPQSFMDWANEEYGTLEESDPSRLILKIDRFAANDMKKYFAEKDIEIAGDEENAGNISEFLRVVSGVVAANGIVVSLLAFFILTLSIFLLLQKSKDTIHKLMFLGLSPNEIGGYYEKIVIAINSIVTILSLTIAFISRTFWIKQLHEIGLGGASVLPMLCFALCYLVVITGFNIFVIRRRLNNVWAE